VKPGQQGDKVEELGQEVEALRSRLNEVEAQQNHIAELEERLDFAERLLAQSREPDRLPRA
jgi:prefoldin subunit 5